MKIRSLTSIMFVAAVAAYAGQGSAASAPLDFSYRVTGATEIKPLMVFNDGVDTFIQPQDPVEKTLRVNNAQPTRQGPYFVVRGIPAEITLSQDKKASVVITYAKSITKVAGPKADEPAAIAATAISAARPGQKAEEKVVPLKGGEAKTPTVVSACKPLKEQRTTSLVASFKANATTLSDAARAQLVESLGRVSDISRVEVIAEADTKEFRQKRGEAVRKILVDAGVPRESIEVGSRASTGIGSEIHAHRTVDLPCGSNIVKVTSRKAPVTIMWDGDAKPLTERVAAALQMRLTIEGVETPVPVRIALSDATFNDAMAQIGRAVDAEADLVLRGDELVLKFKGRSAK